MLLLIQLEGERWWKTYLEIGRIEVAGDSCDSWICIWIWLHNFV